MADAAGARSYEWCPTGVKAGGQDLPRGLLVSTNHYVNSGWDFETPTDETSWNSITRRENLIRLCEESKGSIDAETMKNIVNTAYEEGGAKNELTVYSAGRSSRRP